MTDLRTDAPRTLIRDLEHFRAMAADDTNPPGERDLWTSLAEQVEAYLAPVTDEPSLFDP